MPQHRSAVYDNSFTVTPCRLWNSLPADFDLVHSHPKYVAGLREFFGGGLGGGGVILGASCLHPDRRMGVWCELLLLMLIRFIYLLLFSNLTAFLSI